MNDKTKMTRRRFLLLTGGTVGATALACGGLATLGTRQPEIKLIEASFGDKTNMKGKLLVAYASKCGSTGEVAKVIGQMLANDSATVDVRQTKDVSDLSAYRAVVLGSAIRRGKWLPEAVKFVEAHQQALSRVPIAYFTVCMTLSKDTEENRRKVAAYLEPVHQILKPVEEGFFAGKMDYGQLGFVERLMVERVMQVPQGDFRNWTAIQTWAQALPVRLSLNS
jgi:menaquinone-dependent protoporphyrinogen oxidase